MNYACVILVAIAIFAVAYWYAAGRYFYSGPRVKATLVGAGAGTGTRVSSEDEYDVSEKQ